MNSDIPLKTVLDTVQKEESEYIVISHDSEVQSLSRHVYPSIVLKEFIEKNTDDYSQTIQQFLKLDVSESNKLIDIMTSNAFDDPVVKRLLEELRKELSC